VRLWLHSALVPDGPGPAVRGRGVRDQAYGLAVAVDLERAGLVEDLGGELVQKPLGGDVVGESLVPAAGPDLVPDLVEVHW
jgi:hypothetical protein